MLIFIDRAQSWFSFTPAEASTYATFSIIAISLRALYAVSKPFDLIKRLLFAFSTLAPLTIMALLPGFFMMKLPSGMEWMTFFALILAALSLTQVLYWILRTYIVRKWLRRLWGKSRDDLLKEEADRARELRAKPSLIKKALHRPEK